jgi:hypothetical protein
MFRDSVFGGLTQVEYFQKNSDTSLDCEETGYLLANNNLLDYWRSNTVMPFGISGILSTTPMDNHVLYEWLVSVHKCFFSPIEVSLHSLIYVASFFESAHGHQSAALFKFLAPRSQKKILISGQTLVG